MRKIIVILAALSIAVSAFGQVREDAFEHGEVLEFKVGYRAAMWPNSDIGNVTLSVKNETLDGQPTYRIEAHAKVMGMFSWFFKLDDYYSSWMHRDTHQALRSDSELREGTYRFSSSVVYDWVEGEAYSRYWNHKTTDWESKTLPLTPGTMDAILLFYTLRSDDIHSYDVGESRNLKLMLNDTVRNISYKYLGAEVKDISGLGKVPSLKFSCQLATSTGESFEDGSEFFLWVTDDKNKVPVLLESPIRVGSIRARLVKYSNLKYTGNDSVLK